MGRPVILWVVNNVSEKPAASTPKAEEQTNLGNKEYGRRVADDVVKRTNRIKENGLNYVGPYRSEAADCSETVVMVYQIIWRHIPYHNNLHSHSREYVHLPPPPNCFINK
jgi:hypothetical protein